MIDTILSGVPHRQGRFLKPPAETYAVYIDNLTIDAADRVGGKLPGIVTHDVMIEVYEPSPDDKTEAAIEAAMNAQGLSWTKQDRYWLPDVQRYQVIYEFTYTTKT